MGPENQMAFIPNRTGLKPQSTPASSDCEHPSSCFYVVYSGSSMNPVLTEPALMEVCPISANAIRKGDVILFHHPFDTINVTHRIISVSEGVFRTRGDNNQDSDPYIVTADNIMGIVRAVWCGDRRRIIRGGTMGHFISWFFQRRRNLFILGGRALSIPYRFFSRLFSPLVRLLLPDQLRPRVVRYPAHVTWRYQLFLGKKLIGRCRDENSKWEIRLPYRLLVDIRKLPNLK